MDYVGFSGFSAATEENLCNTRRTAAQGPPWCPCPPPDTGAAVPVNPAGGSPAEVSTLGGRRGGCRLQKSIIDAVPDFRDAYSPAAGLQNCRGQAYRLKFCKWLSLFLLFG